MLLSFLFFRLMIDLNNDTKAAESFIHALCLKSTPHLDILNLYVHSDIVLNQIFSVFRFYFLNLKVLNKIVFFLLFKIQECFE